mmetsp:Transcript_115333/g.246489  ORF Transcript_115333/g.246489 Transcript_115333/m.246489 type:complete len:369 (+) Transcript_115333:670-1776(+)
MALARAVCPDCASWVARAFSSLPALRISAASFMWAAMVSTISLASVICRDNICTVACAASILVFRSSILSSLFVFDSVVLLSSKSHQFLWSSSSFCSCMRWKIIFEIMLSSSSKGPERCAEISCARRSKPFECTKRASARNSCTARCLGSTTWRKANPAASSEGETGEGGGTGFSGTVILTPVTLERIPTAAFMDSSSFVRVSERSAHSVFFNAQDFCVWARAAWSASRSASSSFFACFAFFKSDSVSESSVSLALLDLSAALMRSWRAFFASSYALMEFVSAFVVPNFSVSNFSFRPLSNSITELDLKAYFLVCPSKSPPALSSGLTVALPRKASNSCRSSSVVDDPERARASCTRCCASKSPSVLV